MPTKLHGLRYLDRTNEELARFIVEDLHYLDFDDACDFYGQAAPTLTHKDIALLGCNDRFFLLTAVLNRRDAIHPWLYDRCREVEANPFGYIDLWARYHYKDLADDTPILTANRGWTTHGLLQVGDYVFGTDGMPKPVLAVSPPYTDSECWRVRFQDGAEIVAGGGHLWRLRQKIRGRDGLIKAKGGTEKRRVEYQDTIIKTADLSGRCDVGQPEPLQYPTAILPIDPYVLGAWLGDGYSNSGSICGMDHEIFNIIRARGYCLTDRMRRENDHADYRTHGIKGISGHLREFGIMGKGLKRIPTIYKTAAVDQRMDILRGLMDTDGHCDARGTATFVNNNEDLARDVLELASSLGLRPRFRKHHLMMKGEKYFYWHVSFQTHSDRNPFMIMRKAKRVLPMSKRRTSRIILSVERAPTVPTRCIQVEGGMYLAGRELIPTHNSTILTFAGSIQGIVQNPEITIGIFSGTNAIAKPFLGQIKQECEDNELLKTCYPDVFYANPRREAPSWSIQNGITVKRKSNPKEKTVEAFGLLDGMPTGRHFKRLVFDDLINQEHVGNPEIVAKVTERWELAQNLGVGEDTEQQMVGTRYSFADSYGIIMDRRVLKPRIHAATDDGTMTGNPVFMSIKHWEEVKNSQRATAAAQMLQNPLAGKENMFMPTWFRHWEVRPSILTIYIIADPSKGVGNKSDRTAMAVIGIDDRGNKYLLDGYRHRMSLSDRWQALKGLWRKWSDTRGVQAVFVGYERYGMQSDVEYFNERMQIERIAFEIKEVNWARQGGQSKKDRVGRLEPDFRNGRFYLPAVVYSDANQADGKVYYGDCLWRVNKETGKLAKSPMKQMTRPMHDMVKMGGDHRVAKSLRRRDEDGKLYDVTLALIEEMTYFPFAPKDDLVDAVSRIYDMEPISPVMSEEPAAVEELYDDFEDA